MFDFLHNIFKSDIGGPDILLFGVFHFLYLFLILGLTFLLCFLNRNKSHEEKKRILDITAIVLLVLYLGDFFIHPFMYGAQEMNVDKLPFHLCTISCILIAITRIFPKHTKHIQVAVPVLGLIGALMYITCPNGAVGPGVKAFSYVMLQTFTYHGILFAYGVFALASGEVTPVYKKVWIEAIMIVCLEVIALIASNAYSNEAHHYDWFFVTGSSFGMSPYLMPFIMFGVIFGMVNLIYLIYFGVKRILVKKDIVKLEENAN